MGKSKDIVTLLADMENRCRSYPYSRLSTPQRLDTMEVILKIFCDQKQQSKLKPSDDFAPNGKVEVITTLVLTKHPIGLFRWEDLLDTDNSFMRTRQV